MLGRLRATALKECLASWIPQLHNLGEGDCTYHEANRKKMFESCLMKDVALLFPRTQLLDLLDQQFIRAFQGLATLGQYILEKLSN